MNPLTFRPQLAAKLDNFADIRFPILATPKIDGIRCVRFENQTLSRSLKPIPNKHVNEVLNSLCPNGFDGELVLHPHQPFNKVSSAFMSHDGKPSFRYIVFDWFSMESPYEPYFLRVENLYRFFASGILHNICEVLAPTKLNNLTEFLNYEKHCLQAGYEGICFRSETAVYKFGRGTLRDHTLVKFKRYETDEARVVGVVEQYENTNPVEVNALGLAERSSAQTGLIPKNTLGALIVIDLKTGIKFEIGTGPILTKESRQMFWDKRQDLIGKIAYYLHQPHGAKDKPRFPSLIGFRSLLDI